jgi:hypothetical protein
MNVSAIFSSIDAELSRLHQARALLAGPVAPSERRGRPKHSETKLAPAKPTKKIAKKRTMSPEGRARVAAAQKARWAAVKSGTKK